MKKKNKKIKCAQDSELKFYLDLIEYQYENTKDQIIDFQESFEIDYIEENLIYVDRVKKAIKSMMSDTIILTRALRDKLENG